MAPVLFFLCRGPTRTNVNDFGMLWRRWRTNVMEMSPCGVQSGAADAGLLQCHSGPASDAILTCHMGLRHESVLPSKVAVGTAGALDLRSTRRSESISLTPARDSEDAKVHEVSEQPSPLATDRSRQTRHPHCIVVLVVGSNAHVLRNPSST